MAKDKKNSEIEAEESLKLMNKTYGGYKKDLTPQEVAQLRRQMHSTDKKTSESAKNELIRYGYSTICAYARKLIKDSSRSELYDKRMTALIMYLDAVENYNPDKGAKLTTYFNSRAGKKIGDIQSEEGDFANNPKERRALANLDRIRKEYRDKNGRLPDHETEQYIFVQEKLTKKSAAEITIKYLKEKESEAKKAVKNATISTLAVSYEHTVKNNDDDERVVGDFVADKRRTEKECY